VYGGQQFLNPNASSFPASTVASSGTGFDDEPPLLEGVSFIINLEDATKAIIVIHRRI
jgi:hypothetical protein